MPGYCALDLRFLDEALRTKTSRQPERIVPEEIKTRRHAQHLELRALETEEADEEDCPIAADTVAGLFCALY
jgi:hypothetical protein